MCKDDSQSEEAYYYNMLYFKDYTARLNALYYFNSLKYWCDVGTTDESFVIRKIAYEYILKNICDKSRHEYLEKMLKDPNCEIQDIAKKELFNI